MTLDRVWIEGTLYGVTGSLQDAENNKKVG